MKRMVILDLRGGAGATTIAANLTLALNAIDQKAHVIDINEDNLLRLHFNMDPTNLDGWAKRILNGGVWWEAAYQNNREVTFVPFGAFTQNQVVEFAHQTLNNRQGLDDVFHVVNGSKQQWQVMLFPPANQLTLAHYSLLKNVDQVLLVVKADVQNYSALLQGNAYRSLLEYCKPKLLVSQYQPASEISHDMLLVLQNEFAKQYLPVVMHYDTSVAESIASLSSVLQYAPYSQATQDYHALAFWCLSQVGREKLKIDQGSNNHV